MIDVLLKIKIYISSFQQTKRSYTMRRGAYDGEGKTVLRLLNQDAEMGLMINSYSQVSII